MIFALAQTCAQAVDEIAAEDRELHTLSCRFHRALVLESRCLCLCWRGRKICNERNLRVPCAFFFFTVSRVRHIARHAGLETAMEGNDARDDATVGPAKVYPCAVAQLSADELKPAYR